MPALTKDKFIKRVQTPSCIHSKSLNTNDVKRLGGPTRRMISSKRIQTQSMQTQTVLACLILADKYKQNDEGTQTNDDIDYHCEDSTNSFASRLGKFFVCKQKFIVKCH
ncbi:unnamed protein product [Adineta steineri]|uniref:Uncharacterized protein n=1 Tax=Adineta steineri TaxID=433720 RepID=A0A814IHE1_9BILA|nr:unnamed protein product [Adineta steineri]